jgi:Molecular chaperone (small heat shock protein)
MFEMVPFRRGRKNLERGDYFNHLFNDFFNDDFFSGFPMTMNTFRVDMKETEDAYMVEADLPGVKKGDIDIVYENNYLTISAKRDEETESKTDSFLRRERHYGELRRSFYVDNVDENRIDASFNEGVLKLVLPKITKGTQKRKIDIR